MKKTMISIRLDSGLLDWLRERFAQQGYQAKVNEILHDYKRETELSEQHLLGRAQEIFNRYHAQCFWHLRKDLEITLQHIPLIKEGLRKYGGREGYLLASKLES